MGRVTQMRRRGLDPRRSTLDAPIWREGVPRVPCVPPHILLPEVKKVDRSAQQVALCFPPAADRRTPPQAFVFFPTTRLVQNY